MPKIRSVLRRVYRDVRAITKTSAYLARIDFRQALGKRLLDNQGRHVLLSHPSVIAELASSAFPRSTIRISLVGASRYLGNPNHRLRTFLDSVLKNSHDPLCLEVLIAIDPDDAIAYFLNVKEQYKSRLNLKFFVSPRRFGYEGLHHYENLLFGKMTATSRMAFIFADDCIITQMNFDTALMGIDRACKTDNLYFIHTNHSNREQFLGDTSKCLPRLLWMLQAHGPHSHFPIISRGVIEYAREALELLPENDRPDWTPLANSWRSDCYIDVLANIVKAEGADRIYVLPAITLGHTNIHTPFHNTPDKYELSASNRAFVKLLASKTIAHLAIVAKLIATKALLTDTANDQDFKGFARSSIKFPSENEPLTDAEYAHCCSLIDHYSHEKRQISQYCEERGRDVLTFDRGGVWKEGFVDFLTNMLL